MNIQEFPDEMSDYFKLRWNNEELWALELPVHTTSVDVFKWQLDLPFLPSNRPNKIFDLKPNEILGDPEKYKVQYDHLLKVETSFPIETMYFGDLLIILDGFHRVMNHIVNGTKNINYRIIPRENISAV